MTTFNKPKAWRFTFNCLGTVHIVENSSTSPTEALATAKRTLKLKHGLGRHEIELLKSEKLS